MVAFDLHANFLRLADVFGRHCSDRQGKEAYVIIAGLLTEDALAARGGGGDQ